ncbi:MAG: type II secretion system protein M [Burkholderiales bacterium]|nr:type II secretion system protein M [Burkholderiales bacterium]
MMERWRKTAARFDALARRERVLVFAAAIGGALLVFQAAAIDPLLERQKRMRQELAEARQSIRTADGLLKVRESRADPDALRRSYRDELRRQLSGMDAEMLALKKRLVPPERMVRLLEEVLARSRGMRMVALRTLPVRRFDSPGAAPAAAGGKAAKPAPADPERSIYQHGVELTVQGSYGDLHDYLARLERSPLGMFWGRLSIDATAYPALRATLTVHTLSMSKAWLTV